MSEAERLAEMIEGVRAPYCGAAAAELRRLAAELAALKAATFTVLEGFYPATRCSQDSRIGSLHHSKGQAMTYKLPPLPTFEEWCRIISPSEPGTQIASVENFVKAYAIAAIEAQGMPDGLLNVLDNFEKKERSPFQAYLAAGLVNELRTAMLASAPPAPQAEKYAPCPYCGKNTASENPSQWCPCPKQASVVQQEPLGFISPKQVERIVDPDGEFGAYIPMRKTPAGNFTLAVYTHPAQQAKPQPLSDERLEDIALDVMGYAVLDKAQNEVVMELMRKVEAAHGITKE